MDKLFWTPFSCHFLEVYKRYGTELLQKENIDLLFVAIFIVKIGIITVNMDWPGVEPGAFPVRGGHDTTSPPAHVSYDFKRN